MFIRAKNISNKRTCYVQCTFSSSPKIFESITAKRIYVNEPTRYTFYIYLFYKFHAHSICFERSNRSSPAFYRITQLYNRANVQSCFGLPVGTNSNSSAHSHDCTELCNTAHYGKLLMMNDSIVRNI